jgi:lipopolysaccharide/colanic/teichoic acid biosynthesis glycosyltransferase
VTLKRAFDLFCVAAGLPVMLVLAALLLVLNPVFNPGPLFFFQKRMGYGGQPFVMWKFRTMRPCGRGLAVRGAQEALEEDRITPLGGILRRIRLDEVPNLVNVWKGEMSIIGPRPDAWEHSVHFIASVPRYDQRFRAKPGITGLAQVRGGYADCLRSVGRKARFDHHYVRNARTRLELYILWRTIVVILTGRGAR